MSRGLLVYDTDLDKARVHNGFGWQTLIDETSAVQFLLVDGSREGRSQTLSETAASATLSCKGPDWGFQGLIMGTVAVPTGAEIKWREDVPRLELNTRIAGGELQVSTGANVLAMTVDAIQNVGIGTGAPDAEAILQLDSTTKALRLTRQTTTQRNAMTGASALLMFNDSTKKLDFHDGTSWKTVDVGTAISNSIYRAHRSGNQSINTTAITKVNFDTEDFDTNGDYDPTTNYRFTPTVAGKYSITALIEFALPVAFMELYIYKNTVIHSRRRVADGSADDDSSIMLNDILDMNGTTDYIEIKIYHEEGTAQNINANSYVAGHLIAT